MSAGATEDLRQLQAMRSFRWGVLAGSSGLTLAVWFKFLLQQRLSDDARWNALGAFALVLAVGCVLLERIWVDVGRTRRNDVATLAIVVAAFVVVVFLGLVFALQFLGTHR